MKILLVRHGERGRNGSDRKEPVALTPKGHVQARKIGIYLCWEGVRHVISSPKHRCLQTALHCADSIQVWPCLIEWDEYGPYDYEVGQLPECANFAREKNPLYVPYRESVGDAFRRAEFALHAVRQTPFNTIALVAHEKWNALFVRAWQRLGCPAPHEIDKQPFGAIHILEDGREPVLNYTGHLA